MTGTETMGNLTENDFVLIGEYLKRQFPVLTQDPPVSRWKTEYPEELMERVVRVEEELKHQRELMQQGFALSEKRFADMQHNLDKRFEQTDKRLDQVDKRLDNMQQNMDRRFEQTDKRIEQLDKKLEQMDRRLDVMSKETGLRFAEMEKRFAMQTKILITTAALIISSMGGMAALIR